MPREATINYDQVAAIADTIKASGGKPNPRQIRERHGSGSLGTIHKLFQQWEAKQAHHVETATTLPAGLQRAILEFMSQEVAAARAELESKLAEATQVANDLAAENERQLVQMEAMENVLAEVQEERASFAGRAAQLETDLVAARDDATRERQSAEGARTELAKALLRLESMPILEKENQRLRDALELERTARTDAERSTASAEATAAGLTARLADTQKQLQELKQSSAQLELEKKALDASLLACRKENRDAEVRIAKLEGSVASFEREHEEPTQAASATPHPSSQTRGAKAAKAPSPKKK